MLENVMENAGGGDNFTVDNKSENNFDEKSNLPSSAKFENLANDNSWKTTVAIKIIT